MPGLFVFESQLVGASKDDCSLKRNRQAPQVSELALSCACEDSESLGPWKPLPRGEPCLSLAGILFFPILRRPSAPCWGRRWWLQAWWAQHPCWCGRRHSPVLLCRGKWGARFAGLGLLLRGVRAGQQSVAASR